MKQVALKALLAYLSPFSNKLFLFIKSVITKNANKCFKLTKQSRT